jgi:hypothetical protein
VRLAALHDSRVVTVESYARRRLGARATSAGGARIDPS